MSKSVSNISSEIPLFTVHIVEEESVLGNIDMAKIYRTAYENGYDGVIIASSQSKLTGEAMYFHYKDNTLYNVKRFEVREQFLLDIISEFPDGAYFDIIVSKDCDPYFNYWMNFYDSTLFHLIWISHIFFSLFVMICISYVLLVKWKNLMFVFRLCGFIYILSEILRVWDATFFIAQKQYRQGELVILFQISDVLGGITSYSMSLSALILWVSNFHLSLDVRVVDISESSRIVAIVASIVMFILIISSVLILFLFETSILYYVCIVFFILMLLVSVVYYFRLTCTFLSVFSKTGRKDDKLQRRVNKHFRNILIQNGLLVLAVLSTIPTFYIVSPVQTNVFPFLVHTFFNIATLMQFWYLYKIKVKKISKSTKHNTKTNIETKNGSESESN